MVNLKLKKTLEVGLTPLLCLGSTQKDFSKSEQEIFLQLQDILAGVERELLKKIIFVYEPIWAIKGFGGTPCTPEKAEQGVLLITQFLKKLYCERSEQQGSEAKRTGPYSDIENEKLNFLYGGSVDSKNGYTFLQTGSINGLLIGQASIKPQELTQIIQSCLNYV
jgi:triosephosphate isomerase